MSDPMQNINDAAAALNAVAATVGTFVAEANTRIDAAIAALPISMDAQYFIDPTNGDDANTGATAALALQTVGEAATRSIPGSNLTLTFVEDYLWDERPIFNVGHLRLRSAPGVGQRKVTFAGAVATDATQTSGVHSSLGSMSFEAVDVDIEFSVRPVTVPDSKAWVLTSQGFLHVKLVDSNITLAAGADQSFIGLNHATVLQINDGSYPSEMAGRWFGNTPAGTLPSERAQILYTNLTSL